MFGVGKSKNQTSNEDDDYCVCDEHGHDLREKKNDGIETSFWEPRGYGSWQTVQGINTHVIPGSFLGVQSLIQKKIAPCRDCDFEKESDEYIEQRIVFRKDGEVKSMHLSQYKTLESEYEEDT